MIVLDTNVVSALMLRRPDAAVVDWLDRQPAASIWTTAVTVFEIHFGLALLAPGKRRKDLEEAFKRALADDLEGRVLPFEEEVAVRAATEAARRQNGGRRVDFRDVEIAGIVAAKDATLATRNVRHFDDLGIQVVNPWKAR